MKNNKVVLAYSGGLDTSFCLKKLIDEGFDVHPILVNTCGIGGCFRLEYQMDGLGRVN